MTILTQRILIPTGPAHVWAIVSDINKNPAWQVDCQSVSFLTSMRAGPRARWRYTNPQGHDFVVETTAWYDGLGYEYTYIDGAPFRESKGTMRLQETPEGTVVIWTLNYELGGTLSALRDALGTRRHYEQVLIDSLKSLYTQVKTAGSISDYESRSLMRDAPDYEARARYVPRHASDTEQPITERLIVEPPLEDEDTRPTQSVKPVAEADAPAPESAPPEPVEEEPPEPSADAAPSIAEPLSTSEDSYARFRPPEDAEPRPPADAPPPPAPPAEAPPAATTPAAETPPAASTEPVVSEPPRESSDTEPSARPTDTEPLIIGLDRFGPKIDTTELDTRDISIWEVFDIPRPSESERLVPVELPEAEAPAAEQEAEEEDASPPDILIEPAAAPTSSPSTPIAAVAAPAIVGYRLQARQSMVKLRHRK